MVIRAALFAARRSQLIGSIVCHSQAICRCPSCPNTRSWPHDCREAGECRFLVPISSSDNLHETALGDPMEAAYISAFAALAGTAIGGLTSFATSWITQQAQTRGQRLAAEREARAALFGRFLDEAAKLYSDALQTRRDDITGLIDIYALTNRIRLISSPQVAEAADTVCRMIVDAYLAPNMTLQEMRANWIDKHVDPLRDFSEACRRELQTFGRY